MITNRERCLFGGLEHTYNKVLEVEDQLLCHDLQAQVGNDYYEFKNTSNTFSEN